MNCKRIILSLFLYFGLSGINQAQDDEYLLSERLYNSLLEVHELMKDEKYRRAKVDLEKLYTDRNSDYERAVLDQTMGYIENSLGNTNAAISAFNKAVSSNALPSEVSQELTYVLAQLHAQEGNYEESLRYLSQWMDKADSITPRDHIFAASLHYQLEQYREMIPEIKSALRQSDNPEVSWYEMLYAAYFETRQYDNAAEILIEILNRSPDRNNYWLQLAGIYQEMDKLDKAIAVYELANKQGLLNSDQILNLARLYINEDLPYKAATLLSEKVEKNKIRDTTENLELLATSWLLAREDEKAIEILSIIAKSTNDPETYLRIGRIHFDQQDWISAIDVLEKAAKTDDKNIASKANLLLGISAFYADRIALSNRALNRAASYEKTSEQANWWLNKLSEKSEASGKS